VTISTLWAMAQDLITCVMGHNAGFCYMQLAIVQDFVTHYVPCVGFGYAFWAIAPNNYSEGKTTPFFKKACQIL
jgi:hypothetical protein